MKSTLLMGFVGLSALALTAVTTDANAQDKVRWKMQSAFGSQLPHLGTSGVRFAKNVERLSGGKLEIKFYEPGALIPPLECFDAVAKGSIESCWTTPGYHTGKYPALAFFTTVPFGPPIGEFLGWKWFGGGNQLRNEIYAKHGLFAIDSFAIAPETSGWFRNEIKSIEELKGLKMRFFGLGAQVMQKLGVSTQLMAAADIYPALERGVIDATEFSMPTMDTKLGFHQIAKFNYFPGWHQQTSVSELLMNKAAWEALSDQNKAMIEIALGESIMHTYVESDHCPVRGDGRDARQAQGSDQALERPRPGHAGEGLAGSAGGGIGQGPAVQEGRRPLPGLPQEVRGLGRVAGDENHLSEGLSGGSRCSAGLRQLLPGKLPRRAAMRSAEQPGSRSAARASQS